MWWIDGCSVWKHFALVCSLSLAETSFLPSVSWQTQQHVCSHLAGVFGGLTRWYKNNMAFPFFFKLICFFFYICCKWALFVRQLTDMQLLRTLKTMVITRNVCESYTKFWNKWFHWRIIHFFRSLKWIHHKTTVPYLSLCFMPGQRYSILVYLSLKSFAKDIKQANRHTANLQKDNCWCCCSLWRRESKRFSLWFSLHALL